MIRTMTIRDSSTWTPEERAREERAREIRARRDREKTPEDRLEETLRLSKLMSELQQGAARFLALRWSSGCGHYSPPEC
jgi:hypothetical protein